MYLTDPETILPLLLGTRKYARALRRLIFTEYWQIDFTEYYSQERIYDREYLRIIFILIFRSVYTVHKSQSPKWILIGVMLLVRSSPNGLQPKL
jgi:hypothetical protein